MKIVTKQILTAIKDVSIRMEDLAKAQEQAGDKDGAYDTRNTWRDQLINMEIGICSDCEQAHEIVKTGIDQIDDLGLCDECLNAAICNRKSEKETKDTLNQLYR